ncbi:MAG TPA: DUF106 domain-containing protein [Archaeoglobaceae archaeon]|nr:DUF106 domain-containing protein [Archaeoglobaceae archaeon]
MKKAAKQFIQRFFLSLGIVLLLGIFVSQDFRESLAEAISPIFDPLYQNLHIHAVIFILAVITATYTTIIQRYTIDFSRFKEIQKKVMEFNKEYMDAVKKNNQFKIKQLEPKKAEMQKLQGELMGMQIKPMFYSGIVSIPIFMWLWTKTKENSIVHVPFGGEIHISDPVLIVPWWIFWYLLCSIAISQVIKKVFRLG